MPRLDLRPSVLALALGACSTSGVGSGTLEYPGKTDDEPPVQFTWEASSDATNGTIRAALPDGRVFAGRFLQITSTTVGTDLDPYWSAWGGRWYGTADDSAFVRQYSGRVIAQLSGPDGARMRCHFQLARPESGPADGGVGECELSTGETIEYATLRGEDD